MSGRYRTITLTLACACATPSEYRLLAHNSVGKPVVRCQDCAEETVGPLGAFEADPEVARRKKARLLADGGGSE